jgi:hypothetical protein
MSLQTVSPAPWRLREADFPIGGSAEARARYLLRYAILAPSTKNTQPWKFALDDDRIDILPDFTRWLRVADPDQRELHISLGCALENLIVAADHFGYTCTVSYGPHDRDRGLPDTAASVTVRPAPVGAPRMRPAGLFEGLTSRQTMHTAFTARQIPPSVRRQLEHLPVEAGVHLLLTHERATTCALGALNADADVAELGDVAYRRELAYWVGQGVFGTSWAVSKLGQLALPHVNNGSALARRDEALLKGTPLLGLISTATDDRASQVKAGQVFERVCLLATLFGVSVHPMSQALQIPTLRREVARVSDQAARQPQQLFRLGYASLHRPRHTPRRPLEQLIVKSGDRSVRDGQSASRGTP